MAQAVRRHSRVRWTHDLLLQLGEVDDALIAEPIGARIEQITDKRLALGIAPTANDRLNPDRWTLPQRRDLIALPAEQFCLLHSQALGITVPEVSQVSARLIRLPRPDYIRWSADMIKCFGSDTDSRIARRFGLTTKQVRYKRESLDIPKVDRASLTWTPDRVALLGTQPDEVLARQWRLSAFTVTNERIARKIPKIRPPSPWTPELEARLAWDLPAHVARDAGVSFNAALHRRSQLGFRGNRYRKRSRLWDPSYARLLGTASDGDLAHKWGVSTETVREKRVALNIPVFQGISVWTPATDALLVTTDAPELARQLGITRSAVVYRRRCLGIPGERSRWQRQFWSPERKEAMRTTASKVLAIQWSRHLQTILRARARFGIPEPDQA